MVRWLGLSLCALTLLLFYGFCREWFPPAVALPALVLGAAHPSFLLPARAVFFFNELPVLPLEMGAMWLVSVWQRRRAPWALCGGCFMWGLATSSSLKALAFVLACPAVYAACVPRRGWPSAREAATALLCAAAGAASPLLYALRGGRVDLAFAGALAGPTKAGVDNLALGRNLLLRAGQLLRLLGGEAPAFFAGPAPAARAPQAAFIAAFAGLAALGLSRRRRLSRAEGGVLLLTTFLLLSTCMTPRALNLQHTLLLWPLPMLVVALGAERAAAAAPRWRMAAAAGLTLVLLAEARVDAAYLARLRHTGGVGLWSDAVFALARDLDRRGLARPVALQWGLSDNVYVLTGGRVEPREPWPWGRGVDGQMARALDGLMADPSARFLMVDDDADQARAKPYTEAFRAAATRAGVDVITEAEYRDRQGRPVYYLRRVARRPRKTL